MSRSRIAAVVIIVLSGAAAGRWWWMSRVPPPVEAGEEAASVMASGIPAGASGAARAPADLLGRSISEYYSGMMGDAPICEKCGHITIRNGSCYRCLNCGHSMGCS